MKKTQHRIRTRCDGPERRFIRGSPVHAIGCLCCPLTVIDVTSGEGPFQSDFVYFLRYPFVTMASG